LGGDPIGIDVLVLRRIVPGLGPVLARIMLGRAVTALVLFMPRIPTRWRLPRPTAGRKLGIADVAGISPAGLRRVGLRPAPSGIRTLTGSGQPIRGRGVAIRLRLRIVVSRPR